MLNNILLTGGSGRLGKELQKYLTCYAPPRSEFDILDPTTMIRKSPDVVIHAAAYTNVPGSEIEKAECYKTNVIGTMNMAEIFHNSYFVYISSEQVTDPVNFYLKTKRWGELAIERYCSKYLIIRTLFKENPFPYTYAFTDQYTTGDYLDVITPLIVNHILMEHTGTIDVGTGRKTMFELARRTKPDVLGNSVDDIKDVKLPKDYL